MDYLFLEEDSDLIYEKFENSLKLDEEYQILEEDGSEEYREDRMDQMISRYGY